MGKKSRAFSIYLLKKGFNGTNSFKKNHKLELCRSHLNKSLPEDTMLYILNNPPRVPWWKEYLTITKDLDQVSNGALLFLNSEDRCFALSFGYAFHELDDKAYEYDFGLRVTLNCVDPEKLKSTDVLEPGSSRRLRTQLPIAQDLTYFDFDKDSDIIKRLTGKVKPEYEVYFSHATGASNLRISTKVSPSELLDICSKLLNLYNSEEYKVSFPNIMNIEPVRDPMILKKLNDLLIAALTNRSERLYLSIPDIVDYSDNVFVSFSRSDGNFPYEEVSIKNFYDFVQGSKVFIDGISMKALRNNHLSLTNEEGFPKNSYNLFRCLIFDTELEIDEHATYHLCDGNWYKVDNNYIRKLTQNLDPRFVVDQSLPVYSHDREENYNKAVSAVNTNFICLDQTNISPVGERQVEPCDLYSISKGYAVFYHIKRGTSSASLSHLFNQGLNSVELLKSEKRSEKRLRDLIKKRLQSHPEQISSFISPIDEKRYKVVYAIVTDKNANKKSKNLPLFSRITLMRSIKAMDLMDVSLECSFIQDLSSEK